MMSRREMVEPHIVDFKNVTAYRNGTRVFEALNLKLPQGENSAILGANGSGKTTLLKLISREIYPLHSHDSHLLLYGREQWNVEELRSHLGIVSNDLQQEYKHYAKGRDVILSGYYASVDTWPHQQFTATHIKQADKLMQQLGVAELADHPYGKMSTGQQRRFLLGRALVHEPKALLLDEPTSGLDIAATFLYLNLVRKLMQNGKQLILVTHHIHEIPPEITRVVFLQHGRIVADGNKHELLTSSFISHLFDCAVDVVERNGYYQAMPVGDNFLL